MNTNINSHNDDGNAMIPRPEAANDEDNQMELLMRHSSPFTRDGEVASPAAAERNGSPSPLRLNRPRSNPRNRTPMRYASPLHDDSLRRRIPEDRPAARYDITIRPTAGRAVGTAIAAGRSAVYRQVSEHA